MSWNSEHFILKSEVAESKTMGALKFLNAISCKTNFSKLTAPLKL